MIINIFSEEDLEWVTSIKLPSYHLITTNRNSPAHKVILNSDSKEEISYKYIIESYITYEGLLILIKDKDNSNQTETHTYC